MNNYNHFTDFLGLLEIHKHSCCINSVFLKLMEIKDQHEEIKNVDQFHLISVFINSPDSTWKVLPNGDEEVVGREEIRVDFAYINNGKINSVSLRDIYYAHDLGDFEEIELCRFQPFTIAENEVKEGLPHSCQLSGRELFGGLFGKSTEEPKQLIDFEVENLFNQIKSHDITKKVANF